MYSERDDEWEAKREGKEGTFATDAKVAGTDLVAELALLLAGHFLVLFWAGTPVLWLEDLEVLVLACPRLLVFLFWEGRLLDTTRHDCALARGLWFRGGGRVVIVVVVVVAKVGERL